MGKLWDESYEVNIWHKCISALTILRPENWSYSDPQLTRHLVVHPRTEHEITHGSHSPDLGNQSVDRYDSSLSTWYLSNNRRLRGDCSITCVTNDEAGKYIPTFLESFLKLSDVSCLEMTFILHVAIHWLWRSRLHDQGSSFHQFFKRFHVNVFALMSGCEGICQPLSYQRIWTVIIEPIRNYLFSIHIYPDKTLTNVLLIDDTCNILVEEYFILPKHWKMYCWLIQVFLVENVHPTKVLTNVLIDISILFENIHPARKLANVLLITISILVRKKASASRSTFSSMK